MSAEQRAVAYALGAIRAGRALPQAVFSTSWHEYLFFESDRLFDESLILAKNAIMDIEGSTHICMINLGQGGSPADSVARPIYLDRRTSLSDYMAQLRGDGSPLNWLFLMDRYVCASDLGGWCIYAEKENDVAVLAVAGGAMGRAAATSLGDVLRATSVQALGTVEPHGHFSFRKLVPQWREDLARNYTLPSRSIQSPAA